MTTSLFETIGYVKGNETTQGPITPGPVSYTHLTLPTIYSV